MMVDSPYINSNAFVPKGNEEVTSTTEAAQKKKKVSVSKPSPRPTAAPTPTIRYGKELSKPGVSNDGAFILTSGSVAGLLAYWRVDRTGGDPIANAKKAKEEVAGAAAPSQEEAKPIVEKEEKKKAKEEIAAEEVAAPAVEATQVVVEEAAPAAPAVPFKNPVKKPVLPVASAPVVKVEKPVFRLPPPVANPRLVRFQNAFKQVTEGKMGKREFVGSRLYRLAKKVNPATTCEDEESCEIELEEADPALVEMAKQGLY